MAKLPMPSKSSGVKELQPGSLREATEIATTSIIQSRRSALQAIVDRLMETNSMTGAEVVEIVRQHPMATVGLAKLPRRSAGA